MDLQPDVRAQADVEEHFVDLAPGRPHPAQQDQRHPRKFPQRDHRLFGKRVILRHNDHGRRLDHRLAGQAGALDGDAQKADLGAFVDQHPLDRVIGAEMHLDLHAVMGGHELGQDLRDQRLHQTDRHRHPQRDRRRVA